MQIRPVLALNIACNKKNLPRSPCRLASNAHTASQLDTKAHFIYAKIIYSFAFQIIHNIMYPNIITGYEFD